MKVVPLQNCPFHFRREWSKLHNMYGQDLFPSTSRRRGVALVWLALLLMVFIGFVGLSLDWGYVHLVSHQLQTVADAAALAAAQRVKADQELSRSAAVTIGGANKAAGAAVLLDSNDGNAAGGDIVLGRYDRDTGTFTPNVLGPNAVKVVARRTAGHPNGSLPLLFGPLFGFSQTEVARSSIAMHGGGTGAGLITLDPAQSCSLDLSGNVTVRVEPGDGDIRISVSDTGPGIAPEDLPHIFDRFYKGSGSQGSGLGLTIARNLVEAHGGTIRAESTPGKGTTIVFTLQHNDLERGIERE